MEAEEIRYAYNVAIFVTVIGACWLFCVDNNSQGCVITNGKPNIIIGEDKSR